MKQRWGLLLIPVLLPAFLAALIFFPQILASTQSSSAPKTLPAAPSNLDFEIDSSGNGLGGWFVTQPQYYIAEIDDQQPQHGRRCLRLEGKPVAPGPFGFGTVMQAIDAGRYRGHRVRYRAAVRTDGQSRAQLWMRVDRMAQNTGFFDNMGDRPITAADWRFYEIVGDVNDDAAVLNFGMMVIGRGKAWLDNVTLDDLGKTMVLSEPPRSLTKRGLQNLVAFGHLFGYVRHFHPSDEAAAADWEELAVSGVRAVESAVSAEDLAQRLQTFFRPVAPTVQVFAKPRQSPLASELNAGNQNDLRVVFWRHAGFGGKSATSVYASERMRKERISGQVPADAPDPAKPYQMDLDGGVSCRVPLALFVDKTGTLPHASQQKPPATLFSYSGNDRATRLADVIIAWNIFQHFYPYFDLVKTDFAAALADALQSAAADTDEIAFLRTLQRLLVHLHDGHAQVFYRAAGEMHAIPLLWGWIENHLVITRVAPQVAADVRPGDSVIEIDGKPAAEVLAQTEALVSGATPQWRRFTAVQRMRLGAKDSEVKLKLQPASGEPKVVFLRRTADALKLEEARPPKVEEVRPSIFYIDLQRITDADFTAVLPKLDQAKGIIFDLRGYPRVSTEVIAHLTDKTVEWARWNIPVISAPDRTGTWEYLKSRWPVQPKQPFLKARRVFLADGRAISYAETYLAIVEAYKLAEIVGEPTAGTNGNINPFDLPGGYRVVWTGMKVLKHDGSPHHGVGIHPTVPVSPTIRGVAAHLDEQLERAIEIASR